MQLLNVNESNCAKHSLRKQVNKYVPLNEAPTRYVLERHDGREEEEETRDRWVAEGRRGALEHACLPWHKQV